MRIFFDTEFYENGTTIDLISIGMVREDGEIYYAEVKNAKTKASCSEWLRQNVKPHLVGSEKSEKQIAYEIVKFVGTAPEFWAYYGAYDWVTLCQLYGRMMDLPKSWPMFCMDIKQLCVTKGNPELPEQKGQLHNALADALQAKFWWEFLTEPR